jgi:Uncharacterized protein conserved in bacteria
MPRTWSIPVPGFTIRMTGQMSLASELIKPGLWPYLMPIIMLFCSNLFMTFAWYGHLKFKVVPLAVVVLVSWGIALVEYCFAVPPTGSAARFIRRPNSRRSRRWSRLSCTAIYFDEPLSWTQAADFALIALGAALVFHGQA